MSKTEDVDEYDVYDLKEFDDAELCALDLLLAPSTQTESQQSGPPHEPDEYEAYDFSEFSAEDFAHIDVLCLAGAPSGGPRVAIEVEGIADYCSVKGIANKAQSAPTSPFEQFRRRPWLSVTDLVGPAWCEVQYDYGLRQGRKKKLQDRPASFVTAQGKTIKVNQNTAKKRDNTMQKGKSIHKALEREIRPEEIQIATKTREERWALRMMNMILCLHDLMEKGFCREMDVFGVIHGEPVIGIVDEIVRRPIGAEANNGTPLRSPNQRCSPSTPSKSKKRHSRRTPSLSQAQISTFFQISQATSGRAEDSSANVQVANETPSFTLHLSDTKTRRSPTLPSEHDALQSRLQLMIYHRLLSNMVASPAVPGVLAVQPLDFALLWEKFGLDPMRPFSEIFMQGASLLLDAEYASGHSNAPIISCLDDLTALWMHTVEALDVNGVDSTMELIYRLQGSKKGKGGRGGKEKERKVDADLAPALQASLNQTPILFEGGDDALARAIAESLKDSVDGGRAADCDMGILTQPGRSPDVATRAQPDPLQRDLHGGKPLLTLLEEILSSNSSKRRREPAAEAVPHIDTAAESTVLDVAVDDTVEGTAVDTDSGAEDTSVDGENETSDGEKTPTSGAELHEKAHILGSREFVMDNDLLDGYLTGVLQWWHGERPPHGVEIEDTGRCWSCEYKEGCEWREKKALELPQERRSPERGG
ncbi:exonuclease V [Sparassis latifolia]